MAVPWFHSMLAVLDNRRRTFQVESHFGLRAPEELMQRTAKATLSNTVSSDSKQNNRHALQTNHSDSTFKEGPKQFIYPISLIQHGNKS